MHFNREETLPVLPTFFCYSGIWQGFHKSYKEWHNPTDEGWTTESIYHHHVTILTNTTILQKIGETQKRCPQHWASSNYPCMLLHCWCIPEESGWSLAGHLSGSHQCHQNSKPVRQKVQKKSMTFWSMKSIGILGRDHPATWTVTTQGLLESRTQTVRKLLPLSSLRPKTYTTLSTQLPVENTCSHKLEKLHPKQTSELANIAVCCKCCGWREVNFSTDCSSWKKCDTRGKHSEKQKGKQHSAVLHPKGSHGETLLVQIRSMYPLLTSIFETSKSCCLIRRKTESKAKWCASWLRRLRADRDEDNRLWLLVPFS